MVIYVKTRHPPTLPSCRTVALLSKTVGMGNRTVPHPNILGRKKRMCQAETRAIRAIKENSRTESHHLCTTATTPSPTTKCLSAPSHSFRSFRFKQSKETSVSDMCFNYHLYGHWKSACTVLPWQSSSNANAYNANR